MKVYVLVLFFCPVVVYGFNVQPEENLRETCQKGCGINDDTCECVLRIGHNLTMMNWNKLVTIGSTGGYLVYPETNQRLNESEAKNVITADGYKSRLVISVNNKFPGPRIEAYEDQTVIVRVINTMHTDSVTIHFHGLHQKGSPWMDGVAFVTQCPILPGQAFVYKFKAKPSGTAMYHAHIGDQRSMGLYGPVIVRPRDNSQRNDEIIVSLQDWNHDYDAETAYNRMITEQYDLDTFRVINTSYSLDEGKFSRFVFHSGLINGKGRYYRAKDKTSHNGAPLEKFNIETGETYRFRVVGAQTLYPMRIYIEGDRIRLLASDGFLVAPMTVQSIVVHPGERYDFEWNAPSPTRAQTEKKREHFLVAESIEDPKSITTYHAAEAILFLTDYTNSTAVENPQNPMLETCNADTRCKVFNCPYSYHPQEQNKDCVSFNNVTNIDVGKETEKIVGQTVYKEMFFNFAFPGKGGYTPASVNGKEFVPPTVSLLTQPDDLTTTCDQTSCSLDGTCACSYTETLEPDKLYQFVFLNMGIGSGWSHPVHLHGHSFYVMKMGLPTYDPVTGKFLNANEDIVCGESNFCNAAGWRNPEWQNGNMPNLNPDPPQKDTIIIPTGGYVVVRIISNNPGLWFLHCHIDLHNTNGMGMIIWEAKDLIPATPKGFPVCGDFLYDERDRSGTTVACRLSVGCRQTIAVGQVILLAVLSWLGKKDA